MPYHQKGTAFQDLEIEGYDAESMAAGSQGSQYAHSLAGSQIPKSAMNNGETITVWEILREEAPMESEGAVGMLPAISIEQKIANMGAAIIELSEQIEKLSQKLQAVEEKGYKDLIKVIKFMNTLQQTVNPALAPEDRQLVVGQE